MWRRRGRKITAAVTKEVAAEVSSMALPAHRWSVVAWVRRTVISLAGFRWLVAACEAATVLITWPLWQVRDTPPMLPLLPLPQFDLGPLLLITLVLVLVRAKLGVGLHTAVLAYAMATDQTRIQPEVVSLTLLLWATLDYAGALAIGRAHLVALWCWAGVNKLLSPDFFDSTAPWMLAGLTANPPGWLKYGFGHGVALAELATGVLALVPRTRRLAAVAALILHAGILLVLSPYGQHYNEAIWPWNVALALSGFALIAPWRGSPWRMFLETQRALRTLIALLVVSPAGFYFGVTDAYLAHNLYSSNTASAMRCRSPAPAAFGVGVDRVCRGRVETDETYKAFRVPIPPEPRLYVAYFDKTCQSGEQLVIQHHRRGARGEQSSPRPCPRE
jgi:hypothetical protein